MRMHPCTAVGIGVLSGFVLCAPLNAMMNRLERGTCQRLQQTHQLVTSKGFWGTERRCIDRRYL